MMNHGTNRLRAPFALALAALAVSLFLTGCVAMPTYAKSYPDEQILTPENSSVYYGVSSNSALAERMLFAQMNTAMPPCKLSAMLYGGIWATKPVKAGERYKLFDVWGYKIFSFIRLDERTKLDFTVSNEPGLHYMGYQGDMEEYYNKDPVKMEWQVLCSVQKMYAGTAWEPVIAKRIEELKNAK